MNENHRNTEFLRHCLRYHDAPERHQLEEGLTRVQRNERCVGRAAWLMVLLTALAASGLCYSAIFLAEYPQSKSPLFIRLLCELGLASLICLMAFLCLGMLYRKESEQQREECRRLAKELLDSRLGPQAAPRPEALTKESSAQKFPELQ